MTKEKQALMEFFVEKLRKDLEIEIPFSESIDEVLVRLEGRLECTRPDGWIGSKIYFPTKTWDKKFVIMLDEKKSMQEQYYEIAYQLGNLLFNTNYLRKREEDKIHFHDGISSEMQRSTAMVFAENLLMPREEFTREIVNNTENEIVNMKAVAQKFGVTEDRARARAKKLQLIKAAIF